MAFFLLDRSEELKRLADLRNRAGLVVVYGRRRVGKTALLSRWLERDGGLYSQAIEGSIQLQLAQLYEDVGAQLGLPVVPRTWIEFFRLLDVVDGGTVLCLDEFPYFVTSDPSLPSIIQRWIDHRKRKVLLVLSGSSTRMMHETCLNANSPLYGRALRAFRIDPIPYPYFAEFIGLPDELPVTFELYSLVGGIPKYWELMKDALRDVKNRRGSGIMAAEKLFFGSAPLLEGETQRLLTDEKVYGLTPLSVLEAIGRGASRPSEIASRLGVPQTQLSKVLSQLLEASIIVRDIPFGSSTRKTKKIIYRVSDPSTRFWFSISSVHRSRWHLYDDKKKNDLISTHVGNIFEEYIRSTLPEGSRFWEGDIELDIVAESMIGAREKGLVVREVKWAKLSQGERERVLEELREKWFKSSLSRRHRAVKLEVVDRTFLKSGKPVESAFL